MAVAGASSGAKVAAIVAAPEDGLDRFAKAVRAIRFRDILFDWDDVCIREGGWCRMSKVRSLFRDLVGRPRGNRRQGERGDGRTRRAVQN